MAKLLIVLLFAIVSIAAAYPYAAPNGHVIVERAAYSGSNRHLGIYPLGGGYGGGYGAGYYPRPPHHGGHGYYPHHGGFGHYPHRPHYVGGGHHYGSHHGGFGHHG